MSITRLLFLIPLLVCLPACKKYAEDDKRYFRTPCERIAKKWELYKITDNSGKDYTDSVFYYRTPDTDWALLPSQSYTYRGLILELSRSKNKFCLETGIYGDVTVENKPFSSGHYEIKNKRTVLNLDVRIKENSPSRYFIDSYTLYKMTSDALIFGQGDQFRVYFKAVK